MSESAERRCAVSDCDEVAAGVMEWPNIYTFVELCLRHAEMVGAIEANIDRVLRDGLAVE